MQPVEHVAQCFCPMSHHPFRELIELLPLSCCQQQGLRQLDHKDLLQWIQQQQELGRLWQLVQGH
uniref:DNA repair protein RAD23 n=1 Tax=Arundo donax TaxID=35708 RepID=A0A0A8ZJU6_ARUDO